MPMLDPAMFDPALDPQGAITALSPNPWTGLDPFTAAAQRLRGGTIRGRQESPAPAPSDASQWNPGASAVPFMDAPSAGPAAAPPAPEPEAAPPLPPPQSIGMLNNPGMPPPMDITPPPSPAAGAYAQAGAGDGPPVRSASGDVPPTSLLGRLGQKIGGPIGDVIGGFGDWAQNNRSTLMALGAGMAGSQSLGQGLNRGMTLALPAQQRDIAQQKVNQTAKWLESKGMSPQEATAVVNNPEMLKQLLPRIMGAKQLKWTQVGEDMLGNKQYGFVDEAAGRRYDDSGREIPSTGGGGGGSTGGNASGLLAPGVTGIDQSLMGRDYLKQFSPDVQSAVDAYIEGRAMPTGNPRKGWTQFIKQTAQRVGDETGQPVDDTTFKARADMRKQLAGGGLGTIGGQLTAGATAIGHLGDLAEKARALGNWSLFGPDISHAINAMRAHAPGEGGTAQAAAINAFDTIKERYVQEITKFYSGSPGAQSERDRAIAVFGSAKTPQELAAAIRQEAEAMQYKLQPLRDRAHEVLQSGADKFSIVRPDKVNEGLAKIDEHVKGLLSGAPLSAAGGVPTAAPAATASTPPVAPPVTATNPKTGVKVRLEGDRWVPVQ